MRHTVEQRVDIQKSMFTIDVSRQTDEQADRYLDKLKDIHRYAQMNKHGEGWPTESKMHRYTDTLTSKFAGGHSDIQDQRMTFCQIDRLTD